VADDDALSPGDADERRADLARERRVELVGTTPRMS
jgi:hypothetical protein